MRHRYTLISTILLALTLIAPLGAAAADLPAATPTEVPTVEPAPAAAPASVVYLPQVRVEREQYLAVARSDELQLLQLINAARADAGLAPLTEHPALTQAARRQAQDMADHDMLSHTGTDNSTPEDRAAAAQYPAILWTEAAAIGSQTPAETVALWLASPAHHDIVLDRTANDIGLGVANGPRRAWVIDLGCCTNRP